VRTGVTVKDIQPGFVNILVNGEAETLATQTVLWAAGVEASHLCAVLAERTGAQLDRADRLVVESDLTLPGHPEIFVIGDMLTAESRNRRAFARYCSGSNSAGEICGQRHSSKIKQETRRKPFHYLDMGTMATIGRSSAVADLGKLHLSGLLAWLTWLFVHIMSLVEFENRVLVLTQWRGVILRGVDRRASLRENRRQHSSIRSNHSVMPRIGSIR